MRERYMYSPGSESYYTYLLVHDASERNWEHDSPMHSDLHNNK